MTTSPGFIDNLGATMPGVQMLPALLTLESNVVQLLDTTTLNLRSQAAAMQSIYINNWSNPGAVVIRVPQTQQLAIAPPYSVGWYPLFMPPPAKAELVFIPTDAGAGVASVTLPICVTNALISQGPVFNPDAPAPAVDVLEQTPFTIPAGTTTVIFGAADQKIHIYSVGFTVAAGLGATNFRFIDSAGAVNLTGVDMAVNGGTPVYWSESERPLWVLATLGSLNIYCAAAMRGFVRFKRVDD